MLEDEQFTNLLQRKSQLLSATNELNPLDVFCTKEAKSAFRSRGPFEESLLFIEPDRIDAESSFFRHPSNLYPAPHLVPEYTLESAPESRPHRNCTSNLSGGLNGD